MKILITGGSGFVGRNIARVLDPDYDIYTPTSSQLDFTDSKEVEKYFQNKFFDVVIHCAINGGRRNRQDSAFTLQENLKMFFNLMNNRGRFDRFINFSSGADFDKTKNININNHNLEESYPIQPYDMSKNIISRILKINSTAYNLRIYGVFGIDEEPDRFFRSNILRSKSGDPIEIHQDRYFDFIYIEDLILVIKHYLTTKKELLPIELDLVYPYKNKLSDIADLFPGLNQTQIQSSKRDKSYLGSAVKNISTLDPNLNFIGLKEGIKKIYDAL